MIASNTVAASFRYHDAVVKCLFCIGAGNGAMIVALLDASKVLAGNDSIAETSHALQTNPLLAAPL